MTDQLNQDQLDAAQEVLRQIETAGKTGHTEQIDQQFRSLVDRLSPEDKRFLAKHAIEAVKAPTKEAQSAEEYRAKVSMMNRGEFEAEKAKLK